MTFAKTMFRCTSDVFSSPMISPIWCQNIFNSFVVSSIQMIFHWMSLVKLSNNTNSWRSSRRNWSERLLIWSRRSMPSTMSRNSGRNTLPSKSSCSLLPPSVLSLTKSLASNWVSLKIIPTEPVWPNSSDSWLLMMNQIHLHLKNTSKEWRKDKKRFSSALETVLKMSRTHHSWKDSSRRDMKLSILPNLLMNTLSKVSLSYNMTNISVT